MSDQTPPAPQEISRIRAELNEYARLLRDGGHPDTESQKTLASLLEELGTELDPAATPTAQTVHLAELTLQLAKSLHEQHQTGLLTSAREGLAEAARWAETHAPVATGIVGRFIDVLNSIGI
jgi:hypothetical protein